MNNGVAYLKNGDIVGGIYQVKELVKEGSTGVIYKCRDRQRNREAAVKRFFPDKLIPEIAEKAFAESKLNIRSDYAVTAEKTFLENGIINLVMPFVDGESLEDVLAGGVKIEEKKAVYITRCITRACVDLHSIGILSSDIKSGNVMVLRDDSARLIDFSCFEVTGKRASASRGSKPYAAPELLRHDYLSEATDIYSIGVVFFEMLVGSSVFANESAHWEENALMGYKPDISVVSRLYPTAGRIIDRAIELNPKDRYQSATELFNHLSSYQDLLSGNTKGKNLILVYGNGNELWMKPGRAVIGRNNIDRANCYVSERHLEIEFDGRRVKIRDAGSTNGTRINGYKLDGKWVEVRNADVVSMADVNLKVCLS